MFYFFLEELINASEGWTGLNDNTHIFFAFGIRYCKVPLTNWVIFANAGEYYFQPGVGAC